jgi:hypothetical protein
VLDTYQFINWSSVEQLCLWWREIVTPQSEKFLQNLQYHFFMDVKNSISEKLISTEFPPVDFLWYWKSMYLVRYSWNLREWKTNVIIFYKKLILFYVRWIIFLFFLLSYYFNMWKKFQTTSHSRVKCGFCLPFNVRKSFFSSRISLQLIFDENWSFSILLNCY